MKEKGILTRIISLRRQNSQNREEQRHDIHQLSARTTQLGINVSSAEEKLGLEFEAFVAASLSTAQERDELNRVMIDGLELEGIYCSLALIDLALKEGLPPSTILHLVDGLRERVIPRPKSLDRT
jgi:hypothetical protein